MGTKELKQQKQHPGLNLTLVIALAGMLLPALVGTANAAPAIPDGDVAGLYAAIDAANASANPTTVKLTKDGTYTLDTGPLDISSKITIQGNDATIDGDGTYQVFYVESTGNLTLKDLNVTGGSAEYGGGIYNDRGTVTLNGTSSVHNNTADIKGGGIYNPQGTVTLNDDSSINENTAGLYGAGIDNEQGIVTLNDKSSVSLNSADTAGGGIYNSMGAVILKNSSSVNKNTAAIGGGIYNIYAIIGIDTVTPNQAGNDAIVDMDDKSTVSENTADIGGGIYNFGTVNLNDSSSVNKNTADTGGRIS